MSRRNDSSGELDKVRREIDEIDDGILALLKRRFGAVERVRRIKGLDRGTGGSALRPAREAQVIRRLIAASGRDVPAALVARIWFELMAAATRLQAPVGIHLPPSPVRLELQDVIRFHAGAELRAVEYETVTDALRAATMNDADIMLCPLAGDTAALADIERQCVLALVAAVPEVWISARLPFVAGTAPVSVFVVGKAPYEPSGDDTTIIAVRCDAPCSDLLKDAGLGCASEPKRYAGEDGAETWDVCGVTGFVARDDSRLTALAADPRCAEIRYLGGFANPIETGDAT